MVPPARLAAVNKTVLLLGWFQSSLFTAIQRRHFEEGLFLDNNHLEIQEQSAEMAKEEFRGKGIIGGILVYAAHLSVINAGICASDARRHRQSSGRS